MISLLGVAFGVMVLIVVLSVHSGFERNLKEILLGYAPHVRVESGYGGGIADWEDMEKSLAQNQEVSGAYALIEGYVMLDAKGWRQSIAFRGINTENETQVQALQDLLDLEAHPTGSADMALNERAVVSRELANGLGLQVGDKLRIVASKNLDIVMDTYDVSQQGKAWDEHAEQFLPFESAMGSLFEKVGEEEVVDSEKLTEVFRGIQVLLPLEDRKGKPMRRFERDLLDRLLFEILDNPLRREGGKEYFPLGTQKAVQEELQKLKNVTPDDLEDADLNGFKELEEFVAPIELEVYGVYKDTKRAQGPHVFVPLPIGQEIKGLRGVVEAIGLRTENPYQANEIAEKLSAELGPEWHVQSWMETHEQQFELMKTEKIMMSFALSFITVLSAFSIMAVMYTVTVQKRQEIGVMKALGARASQIINVFLYQGLIVGVFGALLGLGLGLLAIHFRQNIVNALRAAGIDAFPEDFHGMSELPARIIPEHLVIICVVAVILCLFAALVPALFAAFRDPAKSLRNL